MKRCLRSPHLLCLHRRASSIRARPTIIRPRSSPPSSATPCPSCTLRWARQFSDHLGPRTVDSHAFQKFLQVKPRQCPLPKSQEQDLASWVSLVDQYLLPSSQRVSESAATPFVHERPPKVTRETFLEAVDLTNVLWYARAKVNLDLARRGFELQNWPAVYALLSKLIDVAEALREVAAPSKYAFNNFQVWRAQVSLDELTDQDVSTPLSTRTEGLEEPSFPELATLDALTERPYASYHYASFMAEVWTNLGSMVLRAADASPSESKLAMSYVHRILARLHHAGIVSERVYQYIKPDTYQATFRPPGMHLLSSHIMEVLSDAAWLEHEAHLAEKAAAKGEDAPFFPVRMGIKELGHEVWLEFILWCCVEHGHIKEGIWLLDQLNSRRGEQAWRFRSWKLLLRDEELLRSTKINKEVAWHGPDSTHIVSQPRKRNEPPLPFYGLGKRTISVETVSALLDNLPNLVYLGMGSRGVHVGSLLRQANRLKFVIAPTAAESTLLPTNKASNWFTTRVIESGGLNPQADPLTFDEFLGLTPCVVPPWSSGMCPVDEDSLAQLRPSQVYDDTAAFAGLIEYNLRYFSMHGLCGNALNTFAFLQAVTDSSKMRRVDEFFSSRMEHFSAEMPSGDTGTLGSWMPFESSIPHISHATLADLLDLVTISRAFAFGEWLLLSDDIDGPTVPVSAYGDQALAPSILRFAAATRNNALGDAVIRSLTHPLSLNTLRAVMNFRIAMHDWKFVVPMLLYVRDYRIKSWAHSNISAMAAEIIRLEHTLLQQQQASDQVSATTTESDLSQAKEFLHRILRREFHEIPYRKRNDFKFQDRALAGIARLLFCIPSSALKEIVNDVFPDQSIPSVPSPYIPSPAFHTIFAAVAETHGSRAAESIYERFCVDYESPTFRRIEEGGVHRFYLASERDLRKGDPHFDMAYFKHKQGKMVFPNLNTVRIIAQAAVRENQVTSPGDDASISSEAEIEPETEDTQPHLSPPIPPSLPPSDPSQERSPAEKTLFSCIQRFESLGMSAREIAREVGETVYLRFMERRKREAQRKPRGSGSRTVRNFQREKDRDRAFYCELVEKRKAREREYQGEMQGETLPTIEMEKR
ncbi:hypothetical protein BJX61DRAFT_187225 [Aspergillus egyptiacus]|nr:hypothetical protein BJX61DRAFT_187225 [Aspergillus egyptiacus]